MHSKNDGTRSHKGNIYVTIIIRTAHKFYKMYTYIFQYIYNNDNNNSVK